MNAERQHEHHEDTLEARVASLEADVNNLVRSVDKMRTSQERMEERLQESIKDLGGRVSPGTNWQALAAWATVTVASLTTVGVLAIQPLREAAYDFRSHQKLEGHPTAIAKFERLEKDYDELKRDIAVDIVRLHDEVHSEALLNAGQRERLRFLELERHRHNTNGKLPEE